MVEKYHPYINILSRRKWAPIAPKTPTSLEKIRIQIFFKDSKRVVFSLALKKRLGAILEYLSSKIADKGVGLI